MRYRLTRSPVLFFAAFLASLSTATAFSLPPPVDAGNETFQVGDKLPIPVTHSGSSALPKKVEGQYRELTWDDLIPDSWNPEKELGDINWDELSDADPRAQQALEKLRAVWDSAPAEKSLENTKIKLAGFVVPLEYKGDEIHEFLLVPYFGACIHTPPPPANQIVHVVASKLPASFEPMDPFWVSGTMSLDHSMTDMGFSSYRLVSDNITPFELPKQ